jgi:hypothetical protein
MNDAFGSMNSMPIPGMGEGFGNGNGQEEKKIS